ncbi:MAG: thioredoxin-like domain-containing protein [Opitutales bacterium]|nr:thioredoxin-like domain-containing protein [Opitutales bacterium]
MKNKNLIPFLFLSTLSMLLCAQDKPEEPKEKAPATKTAPTNYKTMKEIDISGFTPKQQAEILERANREMCDCGCKMTIAGCRNKDSTCRTSVGLAKKIVKDVTGVSIEATGAKAESLGKPLDIKFTAIDGREVDLAKMKGKVVLIDFWATWCGPCVAEIPNVKKTYDKLHSKGFEIIGISLDSSEEKLKKFVKERDMPWPQYFDGKGWKNKISTQYGIRSIPAMWLVDKDGNIADKNARRDLEDKVEKLLAVKTSAAEKPEAKAEPTPAKQQAKTKAPGESPPDANDAESIWVLSYKEARNRARKEGMSILMEFTGSDWCPPCKALHKNVLVKDAFVKEMPKKFVLLKLDNPRDKSKQTPEEIEQYKEMSARYKITGVPSIILADKAGKPYHKQSGYSNQAAEDWVKDIVSKSAILKQRDEIIGKSKEAKGIEKAKLLDKALGLVDMELVSTHYGKMIERIIKLDGDDSAGLKTKYESALSTAEVKGTLQEIMKSGRDKDPDDSIASIDKLIQEKKPTGESLQDALFYKSMFFFRKKDKDQARNLLTEARKAAPDSKRSKEIDGLLGRLFKE